MREQLEQSVEELELSVRSRTACAQPRSRSIGDLVQKTEAGDAQVPQLRPQVAQGDPGHPRARWACASAWTSAATTGPKRRPGDRRRALAEPRADGALAGPGRTERGNRPTCDIAKTIAS